MIKQIASVGENLTFNCYPPRNGYTLLQWERKRGLKVPEYLVNINTNPRVEDTVYSGNRSFSYYYNESCNNTHSSLALYLTSADIGDSGNYTCQFLPKDINRGLILQIKYVVRIIGCSCSEVSVSNISKSQLISCNLSEHVTTGIKYTNVEVDESFHVNGTMTNATLVFGLGRTPHIVKFNPYLDTTSQVSCSLHFDNDMLNADAPFLSSTSMPVHSDKDFSTLSSDGIPHGERHVMLVAPVAIVVIIFFIFVIITSGLFYKRHNDGGNRRDEVRRGTKNEVENDGQSPFYEEVQSKASAPDTFRKTPAPDSCYCTTFVSMDKACIHPQAKLGTSDTDCENSYEYPESNVRGLSEKGSTCEVDEEGYLTPNSLEEWTKCNLQRRR